MCGVASVLVSVPDLREVITVKRYCHCVGDFCDMAGTSGIAEEFGNSRSRSE